MKFNINKISTKSLLIAVIAISIFYSGLDYALASQHQTSCASGEYFDDFFGGCFDVGPDDPCNCPSDEVAVCVDTGYDFNGCWMGEVCICTPPWSSPSTSHSLAYCWANLCKD